jgi:5,6-dimethylbenzimidazole synthase
MPQGSQPIAILCIGHVAEFYSRPMLELENWAQGHALEDFVSENYWPD